MTAKDIGMTQGIRRDFLLHLGELLCAAERQSQAAARQPIQLSQQSIAGRLLHCLRENEPLADFVRKIEFEINAATAEHMCVDRVRSRCGNLACHRKTKL